MFKSSTDRSEFGFPSSLVESRPENVFSFKSVLVDLWHQWSFPWNSVFHYFLPDVCVFSNVIVEWLLYMTVSDDTWSIKTLRIIKLYIFSFSISRVWLSVFVIIQKERLSFPFLLDGFKCLGFWQWICMEWWLTSE